MESEYQVKIPFDWTEREKWLDLPVPLQEYRDRIQKLQKIMKTKHILCGIVYGGPSGTSNLQYICGYDSWWGDTMVFVPPDGDDLIFVTNAVFHGEPAHSNMHTHWIKDIRSVLHPHSAEKPKSISNLIAEIVKEKGYATGSIAVCDDKKIPYHLMKQLENLLPSASVVPGAPLLQTLRCHKSESEIALLRKACECADAGLNMALEHLRLGITERESHTIIAREAYAKGAHHFMGSVLFGPRSSLKNVFIPSNHELREGEMVNMDVYCKVAGYGSDTHRNAMIGKPGDDLALRLMEVAWNAGNRVLEKTGPGVVIHDLQKIMYDYIEKAGLLEFDFTKVLFAHGCGLDLVEEPYFFWGNQAKLEPGMTFYLEPCLVKHGLGAACTENLILITETGYEVLSKAREKNW
jgi:Xaa-Pro aminopeptidase